MPSHLFTLEKETKRKFSNIRVKDYGFQKRKKKELRTISKPTQSLAKYQKTLKKPVK